MKGFKKYYSIFENSSSLFLLKVIDLALVVWLIPFFISKIGLVNYGVYAFVMSLMLFFVNILNYSFNLTTVRDVARYKDNSGKVNTVVSEVVSAKLVLLVLIYIVVICLVFVVPKFYEYKELYMMSSTLILANFFSIQWFFLGVEKMKYITLITLISRIIYVVLVVFYVKSAADIVWIPLYESLGLFIISLITFVWVLKKFKLKIRILSIKSIFTYLKLNFSSFLNLLLPSTYGICSVFLVGIFGIPTQVSLMEIGVKFSGAFSTMINIMTKVFYPIVNRNNSFMKFGRWVLLALGLILSLIMFFSKDFLLNHWLHFNNSSNLVYAKNIVAILSPIPFLMSVISAYGVNGLLTIYKDLLFSRITVFSTVVLCVSAFVLIPYNGMLGGAMAFLLGKLMYAFLSFLFSKKYLKDV